MKIPGTKSGLGQYLTAFVLMVLAVLAAGYVRRWMQAKNATTPPAGAVSDGVTGQ